MAATGTAGEEMDVPAGARERDGEAGVIAAVAAQRPDGPAAAIWGALADAVALDAGWRASSGEPPADATCSGVAHDLASTEALMRRFLERDLLRLVVVDLGRRSEEGERGSPRLGLREAVDAIAAANPSAEIRYLGPAEAGDHMSAAAAELIAEAGSGPPDLVNAALARGFGEDAGALLRFVAALREALPADTALALRGSTVVGHSYRDRRPFDAGGAGTSDLDIVAIGERALDLWHPDARILGGINTIPLADDTTWVAPALEPARRRCQAMVGRPVSIQVMARWFLDLRSAIQGQPYVDLFVPES